MSKEKEAKEKEEKEKKEAEELAVMEKEERNPTIKDAAKKAAQAKNAVDLEKLIVKEAIKLASGETDSVQQLMAYARGLKKYLK